MKTKATTQLAAGVPFVSDIDLTKQLQKANVPKDQADAVVQANSKARVDALDDALWVVAFIAGAGMFFTGLIPVVPVGDRSADAEDPAGTPDTGGATAAAASGGG